MDIQEFKRVLSSFADEPADVDVSLGKIVAQIREDIIDISLSYSDDGEQRLIVTENGATFSARNWLLTRIARLPQLADRIISSARALDEASKSPFVTPMGSYAPDLSSSDDSIEDRQVEDSTKVIVEKSSQPLPGATSVLYITSNAGEGKTTVINRAASLQATKFKEKKVSSLIVPIPLSGRAFLTFDDAVIAALVNKLRFNYFYFGAFLELVKMGALVPAFDGYEEMLVEGSKGEAVSALGSLVKSLDSQGTVLIAARKAFFEYLNFKSQARLLDAMGNRSASFSRLEVLRWSKIQFFEYGKLRNSPDIDGIYSTVAARLGPGHPLLTRAVLVKRLFDVAVDTTDRNDLAQRLGENPHDYFYTFVNAIVHREAVDKWIARVAGEANEPLLSLAEHHQLLSNIALEMWQTGRNSLRSDLLSIVVDLFCESRKKDSIAVRQIQERITQHALLRSDTSSGFGIAFDHEDFQNFYLGEGLGHLLQRGKRAELQAFLSVNAVSPTTIEQAVQYLTRNNSDVSAVLNLVLAINASETGFSFCRDNCAALSIRLCECMGTTPESVIIDNMTFPAGALSGRPLHRISFANCRFQPTDVIESGLVDVRFKDCIFERLEIDLGHELSGCYFENCQIDLLVIATADEHTYDPHEIVAWLSSAKAHVTAHEASQTTSPAKPDDKRMKVLERFLRIFLRSTQVDEGIIRLKLGKIFSPIFFGEMLPALMQENVLEPVAWKGQGVQKRYKLGIQMFEISAALRAAGGDFDAFVDEIRRYRASGAYYFEESYD